MAAPSARSNIKIAPGAMVCKECELRGDITIGARTIIHPRVKIYADAGPIIIGESNLIEEQVTVVNSLSDGKSKTNQSGTVMIIGNNNVFEVGAHIQAIKVGDHNVVEAKAHVGPRTELTAGCIIGAMCVVTSNEVLQENTVIYGADCERKIQQERPPAQTLQLDFLMKLMPNFHHIRKATKTAAHPRE